MDSFTMIATEKIEEEIKKEFKEKVSTKNNGIIGVILPEKGWKKSVFKIKVFVEMFEETDEILDMALMIEVSYFALKKGAVILSEKSG